MTSIINPKIRRLFYKLCAVVPSPQKVDIIVLCYHSIGCNWEFSVSFEEFKKQIDYLLMKRTPITALELQLYLDGIIDISEPSFLLTFDDGYADILDALAYAIQKNIKPLVFILSDPKKVSRRELDNPLPLLDNHQLTSLVRSGCDIGSHGATHSRLTLLPLNLAKTEISASKTTLENLLGCPVNYFSFPKGSYTPQLIKTVRDSGYKLSFSMDDKIISPGTDPYNIPRIGVNGTHDFEEFTWLDTYNSHLLRRFSKLIIHQQS